MRPPNELGLSGKGVALPKIKAIDEALEEYQKAKKKRVAASLAEVPAKQKLIALLRKHEDKLTVPAEGEEPSKIVYRNGDLKVEMTTEKVSLKVRDDVEDEDEETPAGE
jgi:hypothetical protein